MNLAVIDGEWVRCGNRKCRAKLMKLIAFIGKHLVLEKVCRKCKELTRLERPDPLSGGS